MFRVRSQRTGDLGKVGVCYEVIEDKVMRCGVGGGGSELEVDDPTILWKAESSLYMHVAP